MDIQGFLDELKCIVDMESPSGSPEHVSRLSDWFKERFEEIGWHTEQHAVDPKAGPVLTACNRQAEEYDVAFFAHIDTVFPLGTTEKWRFSIEGNMAYGPGVCDMKQGALGMLYIAREMDDDLLSKLNVLMVFTPDEEIGSPYSKGLIEKLAACCKAAIVTEAGWPDGARCTSRNGKLSKIVRFKGLPAHAGYIFSAKNASAIVEAAHWCDRLMSLCCEATGLTVNIGRIEGGTADNIVAEDAMISFEARFSNGDDERTVKETIDAMLKTPYVDGVKATVESEYDCPVMVGDGLTDKLTSMLERAYRNIGSELLLRRRCGLSDGNIISKYAPVIDSMGACGQYGHCDKEYMLIDTVEPTIKVSVELLRVMAEEK